MKALHWDGLAPLSCIPQTLHADLPTCQWSWKKLCLMFSPKCVGPAGGVTAGYSVWPGYHEFLHFSLSLYCGQMQEKLWRAIQKIDSVIASLTVPGTSERQLMRVVTAHVSAVLLVLDKFFSQLKIIFSVLRVKNMPLSIQH